MVKANQNSGRLSLKTKHHNTPDVDKVHKLYEYIIQIRGSSKISIGGPVSKRTGLTQVRHRVTPTHGTKSFYALTFIIIFVLNHLRHPEWERFHCIFFSRVQTLHHQCERKNCTNSDLNHQFIIERIRDKGKGLSILIYVTELKELKSYRTDGETFSKVHISIFTSVGSSRGARIQSRNNWTVQ